ncbi:transcription mediator complex subunit Med12-domain-containing protein, partial [Neohortaea acidophila]
MEEQELVRSPEAIGVGDDNAEPPAKRAKTDGEDFQSIRDDNVVDETDEADRILPGSPLPFPPAMGPSNKTRATQTRLRLGIEPAARRAHGLDPPAAATKLPPPKKTADFSPWTGNQPEDTLNENVVKLGYFDKAPGTNQAECNSAKPTIASTLHQKNGPGVSLLSYLYTLVLEKRQTLGKCTAPSTFKPPPRVTVTDTKREAWLRDLANPDIPLRKQSRTIPHGIRGKLLMEQCLSKNISLPRAVWLAKCVGANELRAFRRKGVSGSATAVGESKWLLEWTTHVEQFLEDVIASCGQEGWQRRMGYA